MTKIKSPLKHNEKEGDKHPVGQYVLKPEIWEERHNAFHAKQTSEEKPEETEEIEQTEEPEKSDSKTYPWGGSKDRQGQFLAPFKPNPNNPGMFESGTPSSYNFFKSSTPFLYAAFSKAN